MIGLNGLMKIDSQSRKHLARTAGSLPEGIELPSEYPSMIACGPETGNTFCLTKGNRAYVSQDIGDLREPYVYDIYLQSIGRMKEQLGVEPELAIHDLHPDYISTRYAQKSGARRLLGVQHHHAHAVACMYENGLSSKVIAILFDGMGLGDDGTVWGGEFFECDLGEYSRRGHLKSYHLPGGDQATLYPERMAYSCLAAEFGTDGAEIVSLLPGLNGDEKELMGRIMAKGFNSPLTSSAGRLFDAVAAMIGFRGKISFPAEAAIGLQKLACSDVFDFYGYDVAGEELSFAGMFDGICRDMHDMVDVGIISAKFHNTLAAGSVEMCVRIREAGGLNDVVLSGGVFYNSLLSELITKKLQEKGFNVYSHQLLPPGDVCLSLGQTVIACVREKSCV